MPKPSVKHHYLPRYYLNGFTDSDGQFYVYDKQNDKIFPTSPGNAFFEKHLNTTFFPDGDSSDYLEKVYTEAEQMVWPALDRVRASTNTNPIDGLDKMNLFFFLLTLHWRLPSNGRFVDQLATRAFSLDDSIFDYFSLVDGSGRRVLDEIIDILRDSPGFTKAMRMLVVFAPFYKDAHWIERLGNWRFLYSGDGQRWYLVGDNPIVTEGQNDGDPVDCLREFIVPISGNILLVNTDPPIEGNFPPELVIQFNAALVERSERFVASSRKDFLEAIVWYYKLNRDYLKADALIPRLFKALQKC